jgi:hypothetical protein
VPYSTIPVDHPYEQSGSDLTNLHIWLVR